MGDNAIHSWRSIRIRSQIQGHIYKKETGSASSSLWKAYKFPELTFLGTSCGYHFIIIVKSSAAFLKATETIKALL